MVAIQKLTNKFIKEIPFYKSKNTNSSMRPTKMLKIGTDSISLYDFYPAKKGKKNVRPSSISNLKKAYKSEGLANSSAKKIKKIISHWILAINLTQKAYNSRFVKKRNYLIMITLTLPSAQVEEDKEFKRKYLNNFIIQLKSKFDIDNYLWVAEKQKNGNIHFHLIVDRWCDKIKIAELWNSILNTGNYISEFKKSHGHESPPSVKITGQKQMSNPADYLTKYITKSEKSKPIGGVKWSCSKSLQPLSSLTFLAADWFFDYLYHYRDVLKLKSYTNDFVDIVYFPGNFLKDFLYSDIFLEVEYSFRLAAMYLYPELEPPKIVQVPEPERADSKAVQLKLEMPF